MADSGTLAAGQRVVHSEQLTSFFARLSNVLRPSDDTPDDTAPPVHYEELRDYPLSPQRVKSGVRRTPSVATVTRGANAAQQQQQPQLPDHQAPSTATSTTLHNTTTAPSSTPTSPPAVAAATSLTALALAALPTTTSSSSTTSATSASSTTSPSSSSASSGSSNSSTPTTRPATSSTSSFPSPVVLPSTAAAALDSPTATSTTRAAAPANNTDRHNHTHNHADTDNDANDDLSVRFLGISLSSTGDPGSPVFFSTLATAANASSTAAVASVSAISPSSVAANATNTTTTTTTTTIAAAVAAERPPLAIDPTEEEIDEAEGRFLRRFADEITEHDVAFLRGTPRELYLSLPSLAIKQSPQRLICDLSGPDELEREMSYCAVACARTISSYPHLPGYKRREGDPICDMFRVKLYDSRVLVALADGCNWGTRPRDAARAASSAFIEYMEQRLDQIVTASDAGLFLLRAMSVANTSISIGKHPHDVGTTTLFGGLLVELDSDPSVPPPPPTTSPAAATSTTSAISFAATTMHHGDDTDHPLKPSVRTAADAMMAIDSDGTAAAAAAAEQPRYLFACVNVGDCKAFHVSPETQSIMEVTRCNRSNAKDATDPGGRLGPYLDEGAPDLRNLQLFCYECKPGDFLVIVSDGVYDNLDPHHDGLSPIDLGLECATWDQVRDEVADNIIADYRIACLRLLLFTEHEGDGSPLTPQRITNTLLHHAYDNTQTSRDWMATHPGKRLPDDYVRFPGKMDHTTCVTIQIGPALTTHASSASSLSSPSLVSFSGTPSAASTTSSAIVGHHGTGAVLTDDLLSLPSTGSSVSSSASLSTATAVSSSSASTSIAYVSGGSAAAAGGVGIHTFDTTNNSSSSSSSSSVKKHNRSSSLVDPVLSGIKFWSSPLLSPATARRRTLELDHTMSLPVLLHVPLSVTLCELPAHLMLNCHTLGVGDFSCIVAESTVYIRVIPPSCASLAQRYGGFSVFGIINELEQPIERAITLPCKVIPDSKRVRRDAASGIITITLVKKIEHLNAVSLPLW